MCRIFRASRQHEQREREELKQNIMNDSIKAAEEHLQSRNLLRQIPAWQWNSFPSRCPTFAVTFRGDWLPSFEHSDMTISQLAQKWVTQHNGLSKASWIWSKDPGLSQQRCYKLKHCICKQAGRVEHAIVVRLQQHLKAWRIADPPLRKLLTDGLLILQFRGTPSERAASGKPAQPSSSTQPPPAAVCACDVWCIIVLHYENPWLDTVVSMRVVSGDVPRLLSEPLLVGGSETGAPLTCQLEASDAGGGRHRFQTMHKFVQKLDQSLDWKVQLWELSQRPLPYPHLLPCVVALRHATPAGTLSCHDKKVRHKAEQAAARWLAHDSVDETSEREKACKRAQRKRKAESASLDEGSETENELEQMDDNPASAAVAAHLDEVEACPSSVTETSDIIPLRSRNGDQNCGMPHAASGSDTSSTSNESSIASDEPKPVEAKEGAMEGGRQRREQTHRWGRGFLMTFKPPRSWQCTCYYHNRSIQPRCTKTLTMSPGAAEVETQRVLRHLKHWALQASVHATKDTHTGGRGLRALSADELEHNDEWLDAQERLLPPPPVV
eukprot:6492807-Amphidinium_carterae.4